jgi:penicillin-binding protein A
MTDRHIRRLGLVFLLLFVVLFAQVNYIQVFAAKRLSENPANQRLLLQEYDTERGAILGRDGRTVLANSRPTGGRLKYQRTYPDGPLYADVTGYYSVVFGRTDLEASQNSYLSGRAPELLPQKLVDQILGRDPRGGSVITTIDPQLQQVAAEALGGQKGAVAAIDPRTGEVLALVANPTYDPNDLALHNLRRVRRNWRELQEDSSKPMLSNANRELFPPGSTFKIVTAAAALENGMKPDTEFDNPASLDLPQTDLVLRNFGGQHCAGGASSITLAQALEISCNVTFAEIGLELGADALVEQAERFGLNQDIPLEIPFSSGRLPPDSVGPDRLPAVAFSAIGQQSVLANPLHMALIAGTIANGGVQMEPHIVREIRDPSGRVIATTRPQEFGRPISPETSSALTEMMLSVVDSGTGTAAQIPGVRVAGKTGTAQTAQGSPHAWFVAFAPADQPRIAVAVVVLNGGDLGSEATGGRVAAPMAKAVIEAALEG